MIATQHIELPPMPTIGLPESQYARMVHKADKAGNVHLHEALKVAQYVSLALDPKLRWPKKLHFFEHALHRHCNPPALPSEPVWLFYQSLISLVRDHAGQEALRLASLEDDVYAKRLKMGCTRERIEEDAEKFFDELLGHRDRCPDLFHEDDWHALHVFRDQWI
ncbi:hypothetical protein [Humisphaera borealis]|uniref:Uncharacterized protein n=1 Tax=Humisphaera borealis TaxID=2807512 RepID=A0A7M2WR32_9BACT|nr:hypothetical protein [Humisphaera borealis]QOV87704.1 hypothetical protein IPV69_15580 [Humisphaera borealis]